MRQSRNGDRCGNCGLASPRLLIAGQWQCFNCLMYAALHDGRRDDNRVDELNRLLEETRKRVAA